MQENKTYDELRQQYSGNLQKMSELYNQNDLLKARLKEKKGLQSVVKNQEERLIKLQDENHDLQIEYQKCLKNKECYEY